MPRLVYTEPTNISTEAALRKHYARVGRKLGRGPVASEPRKPAWTAPEIQELKGGRKLFNSKEVRLQRIQEARKRLDENSSAHDIVRSIATAWNVSIDDIFGPSLRPLFAVPRGIAMTLCYRLTKRSLPSIAIIFKRVDHTTVLSAVRRYGELVDTALASAEGKR